MQKKIIKIAGIAVFTMVLVTNLQYALFNYGLKTHSLGAQLYAQTNSGTSSSSSGGSSSGGTTGAGGMGCYTLVTLECGLNLGQWTYCNFTGVYGPPYNCRGVDCYGSFESRQCVPKS